MRNPTGLRGGFLVGSDPPTKTCVFAPQMSNTPESRRDKKRGMGDKSWGIRGNWVSQACGDKKGRRVGNRGWAGGRITGMEGMDLEEEAGMMVNP